MRAITRHARWLHSSPLRFELGPENTRYYRLDLDVLGPPKIESTRLQAALRRITEKFIVYDAIDQAILEREAYLNFGPSRALPDHNQPDHQDSTPAPIQVKDTALVAANPKELTKLREMIYKEKIFPETELQDYVQEASITPNSVSLNLPQVNLKKLLKKSNKAELIRDLMKYFAQSSAKLPELVQILRELLDRKLVGPAQVIVDSLLMSREKLDLRVFNIALETARLQNDRKKFMNLAELVPLPLIPVPAPYGSRILLSKERHFNRGWDYKVGGELWYRFVDRTILVEQNPNFAEMLVSLAKGYQKYKDAERLDRVMWWASSTGCFNTLLAAVNLQFADHNLDEQRAKWTIDAIKEHRLANRYLRSIVSRLRFKDLRTSLDAEQTLRIGTEKETE